MFIIYTHTRMHHTRCIVYAASCSLILGNIFVELFCLILGQIFGQVFGAGNTMYNSTGAEHTAYSSTRTGKKAIHYLLFESRKVQNHILDSVCFFSEAFLEFQEGSRTPPKPPPDFNTFAR